jgi:sugar phosphate isomerase/epimerase
MSSSIDFGVQSWCFRETRDNAVLAGKVRALGLDQVELCGAHGDFSKPEDFRAVVDTYRAGGVSIISLGVQTFIGDPGERAWFESATAAGARHISCHFQVDSYVRAIPKVRQWCRDFGLRVGIHCHGGYSFGGSPDVLDHLLALGGPEIGVCLDTAWAMQIGPYLGNPVEWAKRYAGRIYGVHFKDFVFAPNGQWEDVIVGTGTLDLPAFARALRDNGFDGVSVIEYEAEPENPDPALRRCVESMRAALAGI